ncbi:hypothetical protein [Flavobacterium luteum]|uniref:Uncharacterized protein n=1 Tax=Flavobacterium luteum TaxID=2026654 RepID=A0A7J5AJF8_9FLAO|nr:hypothetical protein [Flavobacterium luteum]KAB1157751.1 hypothetical protein F6464_01315 [Flavobacterium luteum]
MEPIIKIKKIKIVSSKSNKKGEIINTKIKKHEKMQALVDTLRIIAVDKHLKDKTVLIPDDCEKYGFAKGDHNLGKLLYFLADMLEE